MSFLRNRPKMWPNPFFLKSLHIFYRENYIALKNLLCNFQKTPNVSNLSMDENSPNLATLLLTKDIVQSGLKLVKLHLE
jgi:hypothetical protein